MKNLVLPDIYAYTNYRRFVRDYYDARKAADKRFSLARFAELAGFRTKTFLLKVMMGEKAVAKKSIGNVAAAMTLGKRESQFFEAMVGFNDAKSAKQRQAWLEKLQSFKYTSLSVRLKANQFAYFSKWYHVVIRELVTLIDFKDNYGILARAVVPAITPSQAKRAVRLLVKLGLIEKANGRYRQTEKHLTTGDEVSSAGIEQFQRATMKLGAESIDRISSDMRDISTLTMGLSRKGFERMRDDIRSYRKKLIEMANQDSDTDSVYQMNIQFFPVSKAPTNRGKA
jgi:uncharacterized protein (TIGR02147 family)